ncbi:MAG: membrane protein insertase YidC, partial [Roseateles sp.]
FYSVGLLKTLSVAPGATVVSDDRLFVGPQQEKLLAELAPGLDLVKDYGIFHVIAKPLFWLLDKIHDVVQNWGWAIVVLVLLLKIAFYGLNASAYRSMAQMKKINPRIMEMRERLKDKPQEMQQEMMRIYKEEKVNPVGGCLPIFLQMPFFIALYWVLLSTVEMRQAPWLGWITDLSVRDPYFILPLLMMASSLLQVKLNPPAADPMQQKMMWIMPVVFGIMFFVFPSGLVLYWLTNNILSIAQQWLINKRLGVK